MYYPQLRLRRLRRNPVVRELIKETRVTAQDLIYPVFVQEGRGRKDPIQSMPGIFCFTPDLLLEELETVRNAGILAILLFGIPSKKDEIGSEAYNEEGVIQNTVRMIKENFPEMIVITDICLCEYTSHGHCGIVRDKEIVNDETLPLLAQIALSHARAGADIVAPSDMMDGRVKAIREKLDYHGFTDVAILSYAAKFASAFYGPFREAARSAPSFGDRRSYQMDPANRRESMREILLDIEEGADMVMIKPALAYLDIIREAREQILCPLVAYNVSGEYSIIKAAAAQGWIDEKQAVLEILTSIKRAGADLIITYFANDAVRWLQGG